MQQVPSKWEILGDLVLLPANSFHDQTIWETAAGGADQMWKVVADALKV